MLLANLIAEPWIALDHVADLEEEEEHAHAPTAPVAIVKRQVEKPCL